MSPGGETGLYRVASAETVTPGLIRLAFGLDFFRVGGLFRPDDGHSQVGGVLSISGAPIEYVELWLNTRAQSNSNDFTSPQLLQSQGDVTLGVKGLYPVADLATLGVDLQLKMLSGIGSAAIDFGASQFQARALLTTDLMKAKERIPFRGHLNVGFTLDNSDSLIPENTALTNAERFALGISDFNRVTLGVGVEVPVPYVTPYIEYTVEFPIDYLATPGIIIASNALRPAQTTPGVSNDIARPAVQRVIPQRITPGVRITAIPKLTIDVAVEIGITPDIATGVLAVPPYSVAVFASYPLDPFGVESGDEVVGPPISVPVIVPEAVEPPPSTGKISGFVTNKEDQKPIAGAVINFDRSPPVATNAEGRFESHEMEPGPVKITITEDGYKPVSQDLEITIGEPLELGAALVPFIKEGTIKLRVVDEKDQPIAQAPVDIEGPTSQSLKTDAQGQVELKGKEGKYSVSVNQPGFLQKGREFELKGGETYSADLLIRARPKQKLAEVKGDRILLKRSVHFVTGEARLAPDAASLLDNVVDVLVSNKNIKRIRIEGHTDNVGSKATNDKLSQDRAQAVVDYLAEQGIDKSRLKAEGLGSSRPIAPNLTRRGREQNRRVEFHILQQE